MVTIARQITAETYYQLPEYEQHDLIQLIEGEVFTDVPPKPYHQTVTLNIAVIFRGVAAASGGKAYIAPVEVYLDERNIYEPDVLYLLPDSRCKVEEKRLTGPPDLVVEVLSPSTAKYDRDQKFQAYERHEVSEYWIVDPHHRYLEAWTLQDGAYHKIGVFAARDTFDSPVLKQTLQIDEIFSE